MLLPLWEVKFDTNHWMKYRKKEVCSGSRQITSVFVGMSISDKIGKCFQHVDRGWKGKNFWIEPAGNFKFENHMFG